MLNAVAETIALLKHRYLKADAKARCVLVGHDWGGVVASRIAAETSGLVDHVVTLNSLYVRIVVLLIKNATDET